MDTLDIILLLPLAFGFVMGVMRGFILELVSTVALLASVMVANVLQKPVYGWWIERSGEQGRLMELASYILVLIATLILLNLMAKLLTKTAESLQLKTLNRLGGALFAAMKWAVITALFVQLFVYLNLRFDWVEVAELEQSRIFEAFNALGRTLVKSLESWSPAKTPLPLV